MPRLTKDEKEQIKKIPVKDLQEIVLKAAAKEKSIYDFIYINYLDKESGEQELYDKTISDINSLYIKGYKGYSEELRIANMLAACIKRINEFTKISKNKVMEADLLLYVLDVPFSLPKAYFGTCFTKFDFKVAQILKRLITIVTKKLHEDYQTNYEDKINEYLQILHQRSNHVDMIYEMPERI